MNIECPRCSSEHTKARNHAQKTMAAIGTIAGASTGIRAVINGCRLGMKFGVVAGPSGGIAGLIIGGVFGAFVSGSFGCNLGSSFGKQIDQSILNNYLCCDCGCTFSKNQSNTDQEALHPHHPYP